MKRMIPLVALVLMTLAPTVFGAVNWPQFRGPAGNGHANGKELPTEWSEEKNVKWKVAIHDRGWSSPVVFGNQIWLTTATEDGKELFVVCVDKNTGKVLLDKKLFDVAEPQFAHKFNTYASPTPVLEKGRAYITFGSPGTACIDTETLKTLWTRRDIECDHFRGAGSSPIIFRNLLIMNYDGADHQFVTALNKKTGKTVWTTKRSVDYQDLDPATGGLLRDGDFRKAYATPHIAKVGDKPVLYSSGAKAAYAYDPLTGKEIWRFNEQGNHSASMRPVIGNGVVYFTTGFSRPWLVALKTGGEGELSEDQVLWKTNRGVSKKPSLILAKGLIFVMEDGGIANCFDAKTGKQYWNERVKGNYSASPLYSNGHVYFFSEEGKATVVEASKEFKVVAVNQLEEGFMSSPAVTGQSLILRTKTHLYRIEK